MSLSESTERSSLLDQRGHAQNTPAHGKAHDGGERGDPNPEPPREKQLSNARLALIMGSIWVCNAGSAWLRGGV